MRPMAAGGGSAKKGSCYRCCRQEYVYALLLTAGAAENSWSCRRSNLALNAGALFRRVSSNSYLKEYFPKTAQSSTGNNQDGERYAPCRRELQSSSCPRKAVVKALEESIAPQHVVLNCHLAIHSILMKYVHYNVMVVRALVARWRVFSQTPPLGLLQVRVRQP